MLVLTEKSKILRSKAFLWNRRNLKGWVSRSACIMLPLKIRKDNFFKAQFLTEALLGVILSLKSLFFVYETQLLNFCGENACNECRFCASNVYVHSQEKVDAMTFTISIHGCVAQMLQRECAASRWDSENREKRVSGGGS